MCSGYDLGTVEDLVTESEVEDQGRAQQSRRMKTGQTRLSLEPGDPNTDNESDTTTYKNGATASRTLLLSLGFPC